MILEDETVDVDVDVEAVDEVEVDDAPVEELVEKKPKKEKKPEVIAGYTGNKNVSINFHGEKHHIKKGEPVEGLSSDAASELLKAGLIR